LESSDYMGHLEFFKKGGHFLMEAVGICFCDGWCLTTKYECDVSSHLECLLVRKLKNYKFMQILANKLLQVCHVKNVRKRTRIFVWSAWSFFIPLKAATDGNTLTACYRKFDFLFFKICEMFFLDSSNLTSGFK
jgi:hypothetical protein